MTTDDEIVRALDGGPSNASLAATESILSAFRGEPDAHQSAHTNAVLEALGHAPERMPAPGEMPISTRGTELEATGLWAAKDLAATATKKLAEAIMRSDPAKGIYAAEREAADIAAEAYSHAAKSTPYEDERHRAVTRVADSMATKLTRRVRESRAAGRVTVNESLRLAEAQTPDQGGRMTLRIIDQGQGSSGLYPAETLEQAAKDKVFGKGLHLYVNHPSQSEEFERPERSVKDLAGVLETDAVYRDGALYAEARVFPQWIEQLTSMAEHIGVSIRATAENDNGTITKLYRAESVDFVTRAGRGGAIISVN